MKYVLRETNERSKQGCVCSPDPEAGMFLPALANVTAPKRTLILLSTDAITKLTHQ